MGEGGVGEEMGSAEGVGGRGGTAAARCRDRREDARRRRWVSRAPFEPSMIAGSGDGFSPPVRKLRSCIAIAMASQQGAEQRSRKNRQPKNFQTRTTIVLRPATTEAAASLEEARRDHTARRGRLLEAEKTSLRNFATFSHHTGDIVTVCGCGFPRRDFTQ